MQEKKGRYFACHYVIKMNIVRLFSILRSYLLFYSRSLMIFNVTFIVYNRLFTILRFYLLFKVNYSPLLRLWLWDSECSFMILMCQGNGLNLHAHSLEADNHVWNFTASCSWSTCLERNAKLLNVSIVKYIMNSQQRKAWVEMSSICN